MTSQENLPVTQGGELAPRATSEIVGPRDAALLEQGPDGIYRDSGQVERLAPMREVSGEATVVADVTVVGVDNVTPDATPRDLGANGLAAVAAQRHEVR